MSDEIRRAFKYRLYPTLAQRRWLDRWFGCAMKCQQLLHDWMTERRRESDDDRYPPVSEMRKQLKHIMDETRGDDGTAYLREPPSNPMHEVARTLAAAYRRWMADPRKHGHPKRKRWRDRRPGLQFYGEGKTFRLVGDRIELQKHWGDGIRMRLHRPVEGIPKLAILTKDLVGDYWVSISIVQPRSEFVQAPPPTREGVGIDLGVGISVTTSHGDKFRNPRFDYGEAHRKLRRAQQDLARKKRGSKRWEIARRRVVKHERRIARQRAAFQHELSALLVREHPEIFAETLNVRGMMRNPKLARVLADASMGELIRQLAYKAGWHGRVFHQIDQWYPSSKTCALCGDVKHDLRLSQRRWTCANGHVLDREVNAAVNIFQKGREEIEELTTQAGAQPARGGDVSRLARQDRASAAPAKRKRHPATTDLSQIDAEATLPHQHPR